jgi:hypothetical protein
VVGIDSGVKQKSYARKKSKPHAKNAEEGFSEAWAFKLLLVVPGTGDC